MSKYKVGDKVLIEGEVFKIEKDNIPYPYGIRIAKGVEFMFGEEEMISKTYSDGLADAWELARKVALYNCDKEDAYSVTELKTIFNKTTLQDVFRSYTIQQAFSKIEAYEESKAIKVGDVVKVRTGAGSEHLGVVTQITANQNCACIVYADGSTEMNTANNMTKTNKHIDIEHLLEQIKGE